MCDRRYSDGVVAEMQRIAADSEPLIDQALEAHRHNVLAAWYASLTDAQQDQFHREMDLAVAQLRDVSYSMGAQLEEFRQSILDAFARIYLEVER